MKKEKDEKSENENQEEVKKPSIREIKADEEQGNNEVDLPEILPILPLRGMVVYPKTAVPITIGQPRSIRLVDAVMAGDRLIGLLTSKDSENENPKTDELYQVGTAASILRMFRAPDGTIRLVVQGISRIKVQEFIQEEPYITARIEKYPEITEDSLEVEALARNVQEQFQHIAEMIPSIPVELVATVTTITDPLQAVYTIANFQRMDVEDGQLLLEYNSILDKLKKLVSLLTRESEVLELGQKIQNEAREEIDKVQREYYLREQLKAIQKELGEGDDQTLDVEDFRKKIDDANMPDEADKLARRELDRLSRLPAAAAEYGVIRTFLEWLISLPWSVLLRII